MRNKILLLCRSTPVLTEYSTECPKGKLPPKNQKNYVVNALVATCRHCCHYCCYVVIAQCSWRRLFCRNGSVMKENHEVNTKKIFLKHKKSPEKDLKFVQKAVTISYFSNQSFAVMTLGS